MSTLYYYLNKHYKSFKKLSASPNLKCKLLISCKCFTNFMVSSCVCVNILYIYTHKQPVTGRFVKLMSSLHFRLGDAESVVNALYIPTDHL